MSAWYAMTVTEDISQKSVLQRKISADREPAQVGRRSLMRAIRIALALAGTERLDLSFAAVNVQHQRVSAEALEPFVSSGGLLMLLEGRGEHCAAACFSAGVVDAIVKKQTVGFVSETAGAERNFTATDAALVEPMIEAFLEQISGLAERDMDRQCVSGFSYLQHVFGPRPLLLSLRAEEYRVFVLDVHVEGGLAQGQITLIFPDIPQENVEQADADAPPIKTLKQNVVSATTTLNTVLTKVKIPLDELFQLAPGQVLRLASVDFGATQLVTSRGRLIAAGQLGRIDGMRAVRLVGLTRSELDRHVSPDLGEGMFESDHVAEASAPLPPFGMEHSEPSPNSAEPQADALLPLDEAGGGADFDLPQTPDLPSVGGGGVSDPLSEHTFDSAPLTALEGETDGGELPVLDELPDIGDFTNVAAPPLDLDALPEGGALDDFPVAGLDDLKD